jgi:hypothetical protein
MAFEHAMDGLRIDLQREDRGGRSDPAQSHEVARACCSFAPTVESRRPAHGTPIPPHV